MRIASRLSPDYTMRRDSIEGVQRAMQLAKNTITCSRVVLDHLSEVAVSRIQAVCADLDNEAQRTVATALSQLNRATIQNIEYIEALEAEARTLGDLLQLCLDQSTASRSVEADAGDLRTQPSLINLARHRNEQVHLDSLVDVTTRRIEELCQTLSTCRDELLLALDSFQQKPNEA